jgi:hypothetical protein
MRDRTSGTRTVYSIAAALGCSVACSMPPGGGVSGTVRDPSGKPIPAVELRLTSEARILGVAVPFAEPARMVTITNEAGHFGVLWSHGEREGGPLLEASASGYVPASERLRVGYLESEILLVPVATPGSSSRVKCAPEARSTAASP